MLDAPTTTLANADSKNLASVFPPVAVEPLNAKHEAEVIEFLSQRPIHTVAMQSMIRDNGLVNSLNRGKFFGCRDLNGRLEGVALVGHATLMETVSDRALQALAQVARECPYTHMIMGEQERMQDFWKNYADLGQQPRLACREWLLEMQRPERSAEGIPALRRATEAELELVMPIQAQLAQHESGVNPMEIDPVGFRRRCLRRIEQGRTWVLVEENKLVFKADVISEANDVVYLEGIWVAEDRRNGRIGSRCMNELSRRLLQKAESICLLANELNISALNFYRKCGFRFRATYETIFLKKEQLPH